MIGTLLYNSWLLYAFSCIANQPQHCLRHIPVCVVFIEDKTVYTILNVELIKIEINRPYHKYIHVRCACHITTSVSSYELHVYSVHVRHTRE